MTRSLHKSSYLYILLAVILWSTAEVVTRTIIGKITPIQLAAVRFGIGAIWLFMFLPFDLTRKQLRPNRRIIFHSAWLAMIGIVSANVNYQYSLKYAGAGVVATVFGASPLFTLGLSALVLGDPLTRSKLAGVLLGVGGMAILGFSDRSPTFTFLGFSLALGSSISLSVFTVLVKKLAGPFAGLPITALCTAFGAGYLVPLALLEGQTATFSYLDEIWIPVLYLSIGTTGLAYWFFFKGLEHVDATRAVSALFLKPPLAAMLAAVALGEPLTGNLVLALAAILVALYLVVFRERAAAEPAMDANAP